MSLNVLGRLGILARSVMQAQLQQRRGASIEAPAAGWLRYNNHMLMRQATIAHGYGLRVRYDADMLPDHACMDLYQLTTSMIATKGHHAPLPLLQSHVLCPLWQAFGYTS